MKRQHKKITVQDAVFDFEIDMNKMTIVNQSEYDRLHKFYHKKIKTLAKRVFGPHKTYMPGYSLDDIVQEFSIKLANSVVKYNPKKTSFNTFFWRNCLNRISDLERTEMHSREVKRHEGTEKDWLSAQAKAVATPLQLESKYYGDDEYFNMSKHTALMYMHPRQEFLMKITDYILKDLL